MAYDAHLTPEDLARIIPYLDYFENPESVFYTEKNGYYLQSQEVSRFRKELDDIGFLQVFDWRSWLDENEEYRDLDNPLRDKIMGEDLDGLRKLMTSYIRGDRFVEGLFLHAVQNGHVAAVLNRVKGLLEQKSP
ncbi:DUF6508 domain-containing protein [Gorillibacterium sp. CAU 1737]|uniref:DUF6508 domain-containing protein n=1 Tax=Gorillibacterium sp. CAU 1737 TaxID=3140362 RepID=UPI003260158D